MSHKSMINVYNIWKSIGKQEILKGVSFSADEGECVCITGRNGCGKTTLLSILSGIEKCDSGTVEIASENTKIGYLPQINPLLDKMSVKDNIKLWCSDYSEYRRLVEKYSLDEMINKKVSQLSGGMKRRLALACAMAGEPTILIMDEPTAALDVEYKGLLHREMGKYAASGGTIIMVSHEKEEMDLATICYCMEDGILRRIK